MPDIPDRDELERKISRMLSGLQRRNLAALLEYMGDPPDINKVPPEFWDEAGKELAQVVVPFSERVYLDAAERMLETTTIGVDWDLVNEAASRWSRQYGHELVTGINQTSKQALQRAVSDYFEQGMTQGQLRERLGRIYSPVRAEMIARTEVTRAAVQGERAFVQEIRKQGIEMVEIWQTRADEIVCPICQPRNGKKRGDGWDSDKEPPAHPRCRCWVTHEIAGGAESAVDKVYQNVIATEKELVNLPYEEAVLFDKEGNEIYRKTDKKSDSVTFQYHGEIELMKDSIFTHNHPSGSPFSFDDIYMMLYGDVSEMRVVGDKYTYILKNNHFYDPVDLRPMFDKSIEAVRENLGITFGKPSIPYQEFNHMVLKEFSKDFEFGYKRLIND